MEAPFGIDPAQLIAPASALGGVIVGLFGSWLIEVNRRLYERKQTAAAVKAELEAIHLLVSARRYEQLFVASIKEMGKTGELYVPKIPIREELFPAYKANVGKIGMLPSPLPMNLALLFTLPTGIREDFQTLMEPQGTVQVAEMIHYQEGVLLLLRWTMWQFSRHVPDSCCRRRREPGI